MKRSFLLLLAPLAVCGCANTTPTIQEDHSVASSVPVVAPIPDLIGGWVVSDARFEGIAMEFDTNGTFRYWYWSDINSGGYGPMTGTWRWSGSVLELANVPKNDFFDVRWYPYSYKGEVCLLPEYARQWKLQDGREYPARLLFRVRDFDERHPFARFRRGAQLEADHASVNRLLITDY